MGAGTFLVVMQRGNPPPRADDLCETADRFATRTLGVRALHRITGACGALTVHARLADPRLGVATDEATGAWLVSIGTWLHDDPAIADDAALLARLARVGIDALARELAGFYVLVAGDRELRTVSIITDLIGSCRAYVRELGNGVAVSSSSLLLAALGDFRLDPIGCQEFLGCGIVYEERSLYSGITKLAPASVHQYRDGKAVSTRYWSVDRLTPGALDGEEAVERFTGAIVEAARRIGRRYEDPVCDLTGGYDSRGLVSGLLAAGLRFTAAVSGPEDSADVRISRALAAAAGLPHLHTGGGGTATLPDLRAALELTHGEYDVFDYARILKTHRTLAQRFQVSLNGSYGEVARAYWWELLVPHTGARRPLDCGFVARRRFSPGFDASLAPPRDRLDTASHFTDVARRTNAGLEDQPNTLQMDHLYLMMRMRCWQGAIASSTNRLWPCLSPFMARPVLETMLQASPHSRARSLLMRNAITRLQPVLARHPLEHGHPAMPLTLGNVHRFLPLGAHYGRKVVRKAASAIGVRASTPLPARGPLDAEIRMLVDTPSPQLTGVVDPAALERLSAGAVEPAPGTALSRLCTLQLALRALETTH